MFRFVIHFWYILALYGRLKARVSRCDTNLTRQIDPRRPEASGIQKIKISAFVEVIWGNRNCLLQNNSENTSTGSLHQWRSKPQCPGTCFFDGIGGARELSWLGSSGKTCSFKNWRKHAKAPYLSNCMMCFWGSDPFSFVKHRVLSETTAQTFHHRIQGP